MQAYFTDVTLRDGLQMEAFLSTDRKLKLLSHLTAIGYDRIEITSFVNPKWVPQFHDAEAFCRDIFGPGHRKHPEFMAFVPNEKGFERLLPFPIPWVSAFLAASETFNKKNVNQTISETIESMRALSSRIRKEKRRFRLYLSTVFGCPYEGAISNTILENIFKEAASIEPDEITLSDTIGVALPDQVESVIKLFSKYFPLEKTSVHFHDTYGLGLSNAEVSWRAGIRSFDGSTGGVGGCPYAKGATGNLALEKLAYLFFRQKKRDGFSSEKIKSAMGFLRECFPKAIHSPIADILEKGGKLYEG